MIEAIPSTIEKVETMAKSLKITIETQETLTPETMAKMFTLKDKVGWFWFAEDAKAIPETIDTKDLPDVVLEEGQKSPSQRLRASFYVYFDQLGKPGGDFESFYRKQMEKLIDQIKERLT